MSKEEDKLLEPQRISPGVSPQRSDSISSLLRGIQSATELWRVDSTAFGRKARTTGEARLQLLLGIILLLLAVVLLVTILLEGGDSGSQTSTVLFQAAFSKWLNEGSADMPSESLADDPTPTANATAPLRRLLMK